MVGGVTISNKPVESRHKISQHLIHINSNDDFIIGQRMGRDSSVASTLLATIRGGQSNGIRAAEVQFKIMNQLSIGILEGIAVTLYATAMRLMVVML